jgi:hypothetical protein
MAVERILSEALAWADHPYNALKRRQTLLYIGDEGGVGKSQIIKVIIVGMDLIRRKDEVILIALTGAARTTLAGTHTIRLWAFLLIPLDEPQ